MSDDAGPAGLPAMPFDYYRAQLAKLRELERAEKKVAFAEKQHRQFVGNRHERRRQMALQRKQKGNPP